VEPVAADRHLDGHEALTLSQRERARGWLFWFPLALALAGAVGLFVWLLGRDRRAAPEQAAVAEPSPAVEPPRSPPQPAPARTQPPAPDAAAGPTAGTAEPELLINPPGNDDPRPDGVLHPHPITPRHERIQRENALLGQLDGAMDVRDAAGMRRLLEQYKREYPEDPNQLQEGYQIVADCLERLDSVSRAAAERYYEVERGSTLRLFVGRYCLGLTP
jgi:hypothetical protein